MKQVDQLIYLQELANIRKQIHLLCQQAQCPKFNKCKKNSSICTDDKYSQQRALVRNNGGDFSKYLTLRKNLMELNYPLVISQSFNVGGYSTDDLCQEGMLGLCEALDRFDISYGNQFSTFAYFYIRKYIYNFIKENHTVKLATRISYLTKMTEQAFDLLVQKNQSYSSHITEQELLDELLELRKRKKMGNMTIRSSEMLGHLSRMKLQLSMMDIKPLEPSKYDYQEHTDSFYNLLNKELDLDIDLEPISLAEGIKLRFGLGVYKIPTPIQEIAAAMGVIRQSLEFQIKQYFKKKE